MPTETTKPSETTAIETTKPSETTVQTEPTQTTETTFTSNETTKRKAVPTETTEITQTETIPIETYAEYVEIPDTGDNGYTFGIIGFAVLVLVGLIIIIIKRSDMLS